MAILVDGVAFLAIAVFGKLDACVTELLIIVIGYFFLTDMLVNVNLAKFV